METIDFVPMMLMCSKCKRAKLIDEFRKRPGRSESGRRFGRWSHCKSCEDEYRKSPTGRELQNTRMRAFTSRLRMNDLPRLRSRERQHNLQRKYGLTIAEYEAMVAAQNGVCAICLKPPTKGNGKKLCIDHCHTTGKIRGLLCCACNSAIGNMEDSIERLESAKEYLRKHTPNPPR